MPTRGARIVTAVTPTIFPNSFRCYYLRTNLVVLRRRRGALQPEPSGDLADSRPFSRNREMPAPSKRTHARRETREPARETFHKADDPYAADSPCRVSSIRTECYVTLSMGVWNKHGMPGAAFAVAADQSWRRRFKRVSGWRARPSDWVATLSSALCPGASTRNTALLHGLPVTSE